MGSLLERNQGIARRASDLSALAERARRIVREGNRAMFLGGLEADGAPVRPLAPATLRRRRGAGPRGAPRGDQSRAVAACAVRAEAPGPGALRVVKSWPGFPAAAHLGRSLGVRAEDLERLRRLLAAHVMGR